MTTDDTSMQTLTEVVPMCTNNFKTREVGQVPDWENSLSDNFNYR